MDQQVVFLIEAISKIPQDDNCTCSLSHAKEIFSMILAMNDKSSRVVQPSEGALYFPSALITP
jgi:hypothetical protein